MATEDMLNSESVKGNMSVEDIIKTDWERNYKKSGVSLKMAQGAFVLASKEGQVVRLRNTFILMPNIEGNEDEVEFHTVTADTPKVYTYLLYMFCLSMAANTDIQFVYTYANNKVAFRYASRLFGNATEIEPSDNPNLGKYKITTDIEKLYSNGVAAQKNKQGVNDGVR